MGRPRKHLASTLVLASALIAATVPVLLPPQLEAQSQTLSTGIDQALLARAKSGDAKAQWMLGASYRYGDGVPQDYGQAAAWFRKAAEQGNTDGQMQLGFSYTLGHGVPQDDTQAVFWWRKAAEQGDADGQTEMGDSYRDGQGVPQDYAQAMLWYRKAADQGYNDALYTLGDLYENGHGARQNFAEAYFWYNLAAAGRSGNEWIAKHRDDAASHLTQADLSREQERARKWFEAHQAKPQ